MANEIPDVPANQLPTPANNQPPEAIERRLLVLEQTQSNMFDLLKWGFGTLTAFAILFVTYNWLSGKSNYDRDKQALASDVETAQRRLDITKQEMAMANEEQIKKLNEKIQSELNSLFSTNAKALSELFIDREKQLVENFSAISNSVLHITSKELARIDQQILNDELTNTVAISNLSSSVAKSITQILGFSFYDQGFNMCNNNNGGSLDRDVMLFVGLQSYISAANDFIDCEDQNNISRALSRISEVMILLVDAPANVIQTSFDGKGTDKMVRALIARIEASTEMARRNEADLVKIKASLGFLDRKAGKKQ